MPGLKNSALAQFYRLLHARGETTSTLAEKLHTSRAHLTLVIGGQRRQGRTWERLQDHLTPNERALLAGLRKKTVHQKLAEARVLVAKLEQQICAMQQSSAWNEGKAVA